jgi:hypothetical protein
MNKNDWYATSMTTNIAESAHALSRKEGKHLSLVGAIQMRKKIDQRFLDTMNVAVNQGIMSRTGNQTIIGRTERSLKRTQKAIAKRKEKAKEDDSAKNALQIAERLIGIPAETVDKLLKSMEK